MTIYTADTASAPICESFISLFERYDFLHQSGRTAQGHDRTRKASTDLGITPVFGHDAAWRKTLEDLYALLDTHLTEFRGQQPALDQLAPWVLDPIFNVQRYLPGEGYFAWHCESMSPESSGRVLAWMLYLNTLTDGGGTEFSQHDLVIQPVQGRLVFWPAGWTHMHRGIVSPTETKYIATGWYSYT